MLSTVCAWLGQVASGSSADQRPSALTAATRLLLVTTPDMDSVDATLATFVRETPATPWQPHSGPEPAVVGKAGLGWGLTFRDKAAPGEPVKLEGDKRAPAGIFTVGAPFGFAAEDRPGYLQIKQGMQICVDDPASPFYSQIVTMAEAAGASGEIEVRLLYLHPYLARQRRRHRGLHRRAEGDRRRLAGLRSPRRHQRDRHPARDEQGAISGLSALD